MKITDILAIVIVLGAACFAVVTRESSLDPQPASTLPPLLATDPADRAVVVFIAHYAHRMAEASPKFAQRVRDREFRNNGALGAKTYHGISEDAREAAQAAITQHVAEIQDDPEAVAKYAELSAEGWEAIERSAIEWLAEDERRETRGESQQETRR